MFARSRETGYERALAECRIAMRLDPADPEPHFHAGWNLTKTGNRAAAIGEFRNTLRLAP